MSAKYNDKDGMAFIPKGKGKIDPLVVSLIESVFDEQADYDEDDIKASIIEHKMLKRIALTKVMLYPIEFFVYWLIIGDREARQLTKLKNIYWKILFKKVDLEQIKQELLKIDWSY